MNNRRVILLAGPSTRRETKWDWMKGMAYGRDEVIQLVQIHFELVFFFVFYFASVHSLLAVRLLCIAPLCFAPLIFPMQTTRWIFIFLYVCHLICFHHTILFIHANSSDFMLFGVRCRMAMWHWIGSAQACSVNRRCGVQLSKINMFSCKSKLWQHILLYYLWVYRPVNLHNWKFDALPSMCLGAELIITINIYSFYYSFYSIWLVIDGITYLWWYIW